MADEKNLDEQQLETEQQAGQEGHDTLSARIAELEEQLAAAQDQALRTAAEAQNIRRRSEQDVEKAHKFALEKFANDLLPVVDSLERGLELSSAEDEAIKPMREGIELTLKMLHDTLKRFQIEALDPHGEPFNPEHHQAMATEESATLEPNTVARVFQKGYLISGRLLRPAMVVVSKVPAAAPPSIDEKA